MSKEDRVIIIGAGLAGLCCAKKLHDNGVPFAIYESSDNVGGRIRTDNVDGYLLDRGFQIFLSAYPEAASLLDYRKLDLKPFTPGAMVHLQGKFHKMADPFRAPIQGLKTLLSPVGTTTDKLKVAMLRQRLLMSDHVSEHPEQQDASTKAALEQFGFSRGMIDGFFRPFLGGIFLDPSLGTSEKVFEFVFEMLAKGDNVLPARGMQAIPNQIAESLPQASINLLQPAAKVKQGSVSLSSGEEVKGRAVVIATEEPQCKRLLGEEEVTSFNSQTCIYFSAEKAPFDEPMVVLDGDNQGPVTNFIVPSNVSSSYAPDGRCLLSAVIVGDTTASETELEKSVRVQMRGWFGTQVDEWKHLRTYRIKYALPDQTPQAVALIDRAYKHGPQTYFCGDYKETGSINGAMTSGRKAAEAVLRDL